ncbi:MAG: TerB family tellurite resistance protein [Sandaracinaceae bacterium]|nr:TerB family tellurite resistance protein [Sandaracinaceae bacterium]
MPALLTLTPAARRTFLRILAAVAAADGEVSPEEQSALRGAQIALGLTDEPLPARPRLDQLDTAILSPRERMLVMTAAVWMALADGIRRRTESELLARLRDRLGLDPEDARFMAAHARWVRTSTDLPWHRELDVLLTEAAKRITQMERARAAA